MLMDHLANENLDEVAARIGDDVTVSRALSWGSVGPAIVEQTETGEYDFVVIPWPERGALGHLLHDHAARQVLDHSRVPVLVVRTHSDAPAT
jgi:nucleotide-binding universal stress UspA family protein